MFRILHRQGIEELTISIRKCKRCKSILEIERNLDYPYFCPNCDENMFSFESYIEEQGY